MTEIPEHMQALVLEAAGGPLAAREWPVPRVAEGDLLIRVRACGVCRTDLHVVDGELTEPKLPLVPGHEIVGTVAATGDGVAGWAIGDRVGVPWLARTCGVCRYCRRGQENLCDSALYTGYTRDGGYAEYAVADARFCLPLPEGYDDVGAAPLLCAGLIGHRAYRMAGEGIGRLGLYGFGAAAHIVAQVAAFDGSEVYAFTRPGDAEGQVFARELGSGVGRRLRPDATGSAGRGADLRARGFAGAGGADGRRPGRQRGLWRYSYERYPVVCLSAVVAGARAALGGQSHPRRRPGPYGRGYPHADPDPYPAIPAQRGQFGPG